MASVAPTISVIIPAFNAAAAIVRCLAALSEQTVEPARFEVIVVDDGSSDETAEEAARYGARVIKRSHSGRASARNAGVAVARGDILLFTDADCEPVPEWIAEMTAPFDVPEIDGVRGAYRTRQRSWTARFVQLEYRDRYDHAARSPYIDFVETYSAAYRREVLLSSGGFDPDLPFDEDQELSFRLAEAGHRMVFNPRAVVYHRHPERWRGYAVRKCHIGYWKTHVLRVHPAKAWRDTHTPWNVRLQVALAALTVPLVLLSPRDRLLVMLLGLVLAAFTASALPFLLKAWRRDRLIAFVSLPMLWLRALALGMGFAVGSAGRLAASGCAAEKGLE